MFRGAGPNKLEMGVRPKDHISLSAEQKIWSAGGVTSLRIGKRSNFQPKTAKLRGRDRQQAILNDRVSVTIVLMSRSLNSLNLNSDFDTNY